MNFKKILAGAAAVAVASTMTVSAFAEHEAYFTFASASWYPTIMVYDGSNVDLQHSIDWKAENPTVNADGTYTLKVLDLQAEIIDEETGDETKGPINSEGSAVFCIDIIGLATSLGVGKDCESYDKDLTAAEKMQLAIDNGISITDVSISQTANGTTSSVAVDNSKVFFGDSEGNGNLRIELYNQWGPTADDPAIDTTELFFSEELAVTFTITGVDAILNAAEPTPDPEPDPAPADPEPAPADPEPAPAPAEKPNTGTGAEGIAVAAGIAALAAGAIVVSKKRS